MTLAARIESALRGRVAVLGTGNPLRGDDAAGSLVAELLSDAEGLHVVNGEEVPESYTGAIAAWHPDTVLLVDAADLGAEPGSMALLERDEVAAMDAGSTHRVPLGVLMQYIERTTGADTWLLAIQPRDTALGAPLSPAVREAVMLAVDLLVEHAGAGRAARKAAP